MTTTQRPSTSGATGHQLPATDLDLGDPAFAADPYPALAALREQGLLVRHSASGMLLATTYAAVTEVLRHRAFGRVWRDREPADAYAAFNLLHRHQMMESEPPEHTRLRRLVAGAFGRGHVERMRPRIAAIADDLLDQVAVAAGDRPVDLISGYAEPLPVAVVADLLGVPAADRPLLRGWSQAIVRMYEYARSAEVERAAVVASAEFAGYVRELATERRREPGEDLLTDLMRARQGGAGLSEDELVASVVLLLNAGHEASVNGFGNGLVDLLRHPDQLATLTSGAVAVETAVEELLRHDPPLQLFERTATAAVDVAGVRVPAGTKVAALLGSANRDEAEFADAERLDVGRDPNPQVGFGLGVHFCLGAPLARVELAVAWQRLLARWPAPMLAAEPRRRPTFVLRGYQSVPVVLGQDGPVSTR